MQSFPHQRGSVQPPDSGAPAFALWNLGFRPFYLLGSAFASLSVGLWGLQSTGWLGAAYLQGSLWHAHEMLFGFVLAVMVGFLFTAGRNWSNRPTPTGVPLALLALLWVAGRILVLTPFAWTAAIVNMAFPLAAAIALAIPFIAASNRRNYFFIGVLLLMSAASFSVHLAQMGLIAMPGWLGLQVGLDLMLFVIAVMAGRVVPMFTNNGIPGAGATRYPPLERTALGALLLLLAVDVLQVGGTVFIGIAAACACLHLARWLFWKPWRTLREPMVWVLHAAYAWVPLHLALRGLGEAGWIAPTTATHALTVGAAGVLIIGMMTRTARGHTGRELRADAADITCYTLIFAAAVVRVMLPLIAPQYTLESIVWSAGLWSAGFGLYAVRYWAVLSRARVDGTPG